MYVCVMPFAVTAATTGSSKDADLETNVNRIANSTTPSAPVMLVVVTRSTAGAKDAAEWARMMVYWTVKWSPDVALAATCMVSTGSVTTNFCPVDTAGDATPPFNCNTAPAAT